MLFSWIIQWDPDLNYRAISVVYAVACVGAVFLYVGETFGSLPQTQWTSSLNGLYMVFVPYVPCLIWMLLIRTVRRRKTLDNKLALKKDQ
jgi:membrane protein DedA with SNARE-associated domain